MRWLPIAGLVIVFLGAYAAGGQLLTCTAVKTTPAPPATTAECRVETRRVLGLLSVSSQSYREITGVEAGAVASRTSTATPSGRTRADGDDVSLRLLSRDTEIARVRGTEEQVDAAVDRLRAWLAEGTPRPIRVSLSQWGFAAAAMAFGAAWTLATRFLAGLAAQQRARDLALAQQNATEGR